MGGQSPTAVPEAATITAAASVRRFAVQLIAWQPRRFIWVTAVSAVSGLTQAIGTLLLLPLVGLVGVGASGGVARTVRHAFTAVGLRPTLAVVLIAYACVAALTAGLGAYQAVITTRYRLEFADQMRGRLYSATAHAGWHQLLQLRQSDLLTTLTTNVSYIGQGAAGAMTVTVTALTVAWQLLVAGRISPPLTGLAVLCGIGLIGVIWPLVRRSRRLGRELMAGNRGIMRMATGFLDSLKLAKAYGREDRHVVSFTGAMTRSRTAQIAFARTAAEAGAVQTILTAVMLAIVIDVSVTRFHVAAGSLLVVAFVFTRVVAQVAGLQNGVELMAQAAPALEEIVALLAICERAGERLPPGAPGPALSLQSGVELRDVRFAYAGTGPAVRNAVDGVSLEIPRGSMVALAGPSGAGKTTLADLIVGLLSPDSGTVLVDGAPLSAERLGPWRGAVALVPQEPFLFHDTIRANLLWAADGTSEDDLWAALVQAACAEFVSTLPDGLDTVVGNRGTRLSGGERQRLALARALLRRPALLVLDEATSSLDSENEWAIRQTLAALHGRTTMLVIAHRLATARDADRIAVMEAGRIVETGTWEELTTRGDGRLRDLIETGTSTVR